MPYVENTRLLVETGMAVATGNIYTGLLEFESQSFVLHGLRPTSLFLDIGANIGMYTVLAGGAVGASCISVEPTPSTYSSLCQNIHINRLNDIVDHRNVGAGKEGGELKFADTDGPANRVLQENSRESGTEVNVTTVDGLLAERDDETDDLIIKVDVEGWESAVIEGSEAVLSRTTPTALLVELNGMGERYGFDDDEVHEGLVSRGYNPVEYNPHQRNIHLKEDRNTEENTIYVNEIDFFQERVRKSKSYIISNIDKRI